MAILMYHHIAQAPEAVDPRHGGLWVPPAEFEDQLKCLQSWGYESVSLDRVVRSAVEKSPLPRRWVCLTFDDARIDNLTVAAPLCEKHGFKMAVFAVSRWTVGLVSESEWISQPPWEEALDRAGLEELLRRGHEIGSHTATHPRLTRLDDDGVRMELASSRDALSNLSCGAPHFLAYPYGNIAPRIMELARNCGYKGAVSTIRDNRVAGADPMALPRVMVQPGTSRIRFRYMLSIAYSLIHRMKNRSRWNGMNTP